MDYFLIFHRQVAWTQSINMDHDLGIGMIFNSEEKVGFIVLSVSVPENFSQLVPEKATGQSGCFQL